MNNNRKMTTLFLDIDGVLNNLPLLFNNIPLVKNEMVKGKMEDNMIDQSCVRALNELVDNIECEVVLSSSWRIIYELDFINNLLKRHGATFEITGKTPSISGKRIRGDEIKEYMSVNKCEKYIILDDDSDMLEEQKEYFFKVDPQTGLTLDYVQKIINYMGKR